MRKVLVYDSASGSWYGQATSVDEGDFPKGRTTFCVVAASAPDGSSHNIYMYGGESKSNEPSAFKDMWILSIPSFRWIRVNVESVPRKAHGCTAVAQRYMLTYGGVASGWGVEGDEEECDQKNYGLRLFHLSNLDWTTQYDGPASSTQGYTVPKLVYDKIGGNEQGKATQTAPKAGFETAALSSIFRASNATPTNSASISTVPSNSPSNTPASPGNPASEPSKSSKAGPIAGGVVGGAIVIALFIVGVFWLLRRRNRLAEHTQQPAARYEVQGSNMWPVESANNQAPKYGVYTHDGPPQELYTGRPPQEMYAGQPSPLPQHALPQHTHPLK